MELAFAVVKRNEQIHRPHEPYLGCCRNSFVTATAIVTSLRHFQPNCGVWDSIFLRQVIISTFAIISVQRMLVTHGRMFFFVCTVEVCMSAHSRKACTPLLNQLRIPHAILDHSHQIHWTWMSGRHVHSFQQMVGTNTAQLAQTDKARFTCHSTILLSTLWLMKMSM